MKLSVAELLGRRTLIIGDVGKGKTSLTLQIVMKLLKLGYSEEVTVLDFAPNKILIEGVQVGGKLADFGLSLSGVRYYTDDIAAPRLTSKSRDEVIRLASLNRVKCHHLLQKFQANPTSILVINDVTLYFQVGDLGLLPQALSVAETFVANGYFGKTLKEDLGSGISRNERLMMMKLIELADYVVDLNKIDIVDVDC
ncbi:MAG: hypothetical protein NDF55_01060 [archaeon GB-1867-005]|nr:hypothetical protein [Candidatus Culexmicrobium cathedralense]